MPFIIVRQDITKMETDAIVNAANRGLQRGGGVCGAIFQAAGAEKLQKACNQLAPIQTGGAAITPGFGLRARYIIHAVGPIYSRIFSKRCEKALYSAYWEALLLAERYHCESIAFPLISSGIYGYPKDEALRVASAAIADFLAEHEMEIYLVVYDRASFAVSEALLGDVASYIDEHYVEAHPAHRRRPLQTDGDKMAVWPEAQQEQEEDTCALPLMSAPSAVAQDEADFGTGLDELLGQLDEPFSITLLKLIDAKGKTDAEVYKKANIDRKLFSKIRTGKYYTPKKSTILALSVALELTLPETNNLLGRAGYALSHASRFDVIVEYFIVRRRYNIFEINEVLFSYDQPLLGG